MVAASSNKWGPTKILPASTPPTKLSATSITLDLPPLFSGLLPPFYLFFDLVLTHYQIHALRLDPRYVLLVSSFAFLCEDILGVPPSVAFLRNFFSLQLIMPDQRSGCVSFQCTKRDDERVHRHGDWSLRRRPQGQWLVIDAGQNNPLLLVPSSLVAPRSRWEHAPLFHPRLLLVMGRLETLKEVGVTAALIVKEFLKRQIALLQRLSHPMWSFFGPNNTMQLHMWRLPCNTLDGLLQALLGKSVGTLPRRRCPLYKSKNGEDFAWATPIVDQRGCFTEGMRGLGACLSWWPLSRGPA
ncbi:hypothetical protein D1007_52810 [Hordeum vulgare]|nr:hypothetical protein D1007_52810 [Hordeum vulgare]